MIEKLINKFLERKGWEVSPEVSISTDVFIELFGSQLEKITYRNGIILVPEETDLVTIGSFEGHWKDRNPLNIPGPIYGAETDTCCIGHFEAPKNVAHDADGCEFVFRQPRNQDELLAVMHSVSVDPFAGYGCDGNDHWNFTLIKEWCSVFAEFQNTIATFVDYAPEWVGGPESRNIWQRDYEAMGQSELADYLSKYAFYIEHGRVPDDNETLPELSLPKY